MSREVGRRGPRAWAVRRGDWVAAPPERSSIKLKFYKNPESANLPPEVVPCPIHPFARDCTYIKPEQLIGPVHAVDHGLGSLTRFVAVQVEHPLRPGELVWMNIWAADAGGFQGINYGRVLGDADLAEWLRRGWRNTYLD